MNLPALSLFCPGAEHQTIAGKGKFSASGHHLGGTDTDGREKPYGVRAVVAWATEEPFSIKASISMGGKSFGGATACLPPYSGGTKCKFCPSILHMALLFMLFLDLMKSKQVKVWWCGHIGSRHTNSSCLYESWHCLKLYRRMKSSKSGWDAPVCIFPLCTPSKVSWGGGGWVCLLCWC